MGHAPAHARWVSNWQSVGVLVTTLLLLFGADSAMAQTAEVQPVTVSAEAVPTATLHDNWREMPQHIMPEVSGTEMLQHYVECDLRVGAILVRRERCGLTLSRCATNSGETVGVSRPRCFRRVLHHKKHPRVQR